MGAITDFLALAITIAVFAGTIYGVMLVTQLINSGVQTTKENLKTRGLDISDRGVKVKTNKRFDRDDYVDATQRGFIKAMGAASFGQASPNGSPSSSQSALSPPPLQRSVSSQSFTSEEKKKKGSGFMKRALSGSKDK